MRILHVLNHIERLSGNVHAAIDLACAQAKAGHSVAVAGRPTGDFEATLANCGVAFFPIDFRRTLRHLALAETRLLRLLRGWRPDVVHAHMMTSAVLAAPLCAILRRPLITSVHNAFERGAIFMALGRRIVAVSGRVAESLKRRGFPSKRLRVVLNGTIGSARFPFPRRDRLSLQRPAILFVGGLHPRKGVDDLLRAFAFLRGSNRDAHLYIVGEGPVGEEYKALAAELGIADRVCFCGRADDPSVYMRGADIFVLCSHADPAPLVLSEAREAGCAIVASDVDGIPEMLEEGRAGLLVPAGDAKHLSEVIAHLVDDPNALDDWKRRSQIGLERLELRRVVDDMSLVYKDALQSFRTPSRKSDERSILSRST